jgi:hypothetical protein
MLKAIILVLGAATYLAFLKYESNVALTAASQLEKLYTSTGAPSDLLAASSR